MTVADFAGLIQPGEFGFECDDAKRAAFDRMNSCILAERTPVDLCFIGDSITESFELNAYFYRFGLCVNRGIGGDRVHYLRRRLNADLLQLRPRVGILSVGINDTATLLDAHRGETRLPEEDLANFLSEMGEEYRGICEQCRNAGQRMVLCSVMPVGVDDFRNDLVRGMNKLILGLCEEYGFGYADYYGAVADERGLLREVTFGDLLHPHAVGYRAMADTLIPVLENAFQTPYQRT